MLTAASDSTAVLRPKLKHLRQQLNVATSQLLPGTIDANDLHAVLGIVGQCFEVNEDLQIRTVLLGLRSWNRWR